MKRFPPIVLASALALCAAGLHAASDARDRARDANRLGSIRVEPLVVPGDSEWSPENGQRLPVAALTIAQGRDSEFSYARSNGLWRVPEYFGAIASEGRIVGVMEALAGASRVTLPGTGNPADFGLETDQRKRISLHGAGFLSAEDRDVLFSVDVGASIPGASSTGSAGCYARIVGTPQIIELDVDLQALLVDPPAPPGSPRRIPSGARPPLLERRLVPGGWPGSRSGIRRIAVERADGTGFEMLLTAAGEVGPNGEPPAPRYQLKVAGELGPPIETHPVLSTGYTLFLIQAPAVECIDPRTVDGSRVNDPEAIVTLEAIEGPPLELRVLRGGFGEDPLLIDTFGQAVYRISDQVLELLLPEPAQLTDPARGIAWDAYLR